MSYETFCEFSSGNAVLTLLLTVNSHQLKAESCSRDSSSGTALEARGSAVKAQRSVLKSSQDQILRNNENLRSANLSVALVFAFGGAGV